MKRSIFITVMMLCFLSLPIYPAAAQELVVGTLFDHSGALKDWGPRHQRAAELAAKQIEAAGLTLRFVHQDSQTDAEASKKAARTLIEKERVAAIIGSSSSGVIIPVAEEVTIPAGMLMISPGATSAYITDLPQDAGKDFLFRTCPSRRLRYRQHGAVQFRGRGGAGYLFRTGMDHRPGADGLHRPGHLTKKSQRRQRENSTKIDIVVGIEIAWEF